LLSIESQIKTRGQLLLLIIKVLTANFIVFSILELIWVSVFLSSPILVNAISYKLISSKFDGSKCDELENDTLYWRSLYSITLK